jgi:hypothetical protein
MFNDRGEQVATIHGRWGSEIFGEILRPLLDWYNPLICGEQQVGLPVLRKLYKWGYWMYYDRDEKKRSRPMNERLGHFKTGSHLPIMMLRGALFPFNSDGSPRRPDVIIRDSEVLDELAAFQFTPPKGMELQDAGDEQLKMGAPPGFHDDLVNAAGYAWMALHDLPHYEDTKPAFAPDSIAVQLGHVHDLLGTKPPAQGNIVWNPPER